MTLYIYWLLNILLVFGYIYVYTTYEVISESSVKQVRYQKWYKLIVFLIFSIGIIQLSFLHFSLGHMNMSISFSIYLVFYSAAYLEIPLLLSIFSVFMLTNYIISPFISSFPLLSIYYLAILAICLIGRKKKSATWYIFGMGSVITLLFTMLTLDTMGHDMGTIVQVSLIYSLSIGITLFYLWSNRVVRQLSLNLKKSIIKMNSLFQNRKVAIIQVDDKDIIVEHNEAVFQIFGITFPIKQWSGRDFFDLAMGEYFQQYVVDLEQYEKGLQEIKEKKEETLNTVLHLKTGITIEIDFFPLYVNKKYEGGYLYFRDITKRTVAEQRLKELSLELERLAITDGLTGLLNRRKLERDLEEIIKQHQETGESLTFFMIDIDYFKKYNDYYGHFEGDMCLHRVAKILKDTMRKKLDYVYRYGGEEFSLILIDTDEEGAMKVANRLIENVNQANIPHEASSVSPHVTLSIGVVTWNASESSLTAKELITHGDELLYQSKENGRNQYQFKRI